MTEQQERKPRVLIGSYTFEGKEYCRERFVETLKRIKLDGETKWVLLDNSRNPRYFHKLQRLYPGHVWRIPRGENSRDAIANSMNFLRAKALEENYDWLFIVESDLFPPPDALQRLIDHHRPVVGGVYDIGFGPNKGPCLFITTKLKDSVFEGTRRLSPREAATWIGTGLREVHGMGVGCTLIHRYILERFPFWYSSADDDRMEGLGIKKHPDTYFYMDLHNAGIVVHCDTNLYVEHQPSGWDKVGDM